MQRIDGQLLLSPTDLTKHLACAHVTTLDVLALDGRRGLRAAAPDDALQLVFRKGIEHESAYLDRLRSQGLRVAEIATRFDLEGRRQAEDETLAAMREGVDVVYQATFFDGRWGGQADFLLRTDRPSELGSWSYDIADTKLARRLKVPALLQMATYAERLAVLQGVPPRAAHRRDRRRGRAALAAGRRRVVRAARPCPSAGGGRDGCRRRSRFRSATARSAAGPPTAPTCGSRPTTSRSWPACARGTAMR